MSDVRVAAVRCRACDAAISATFADLGMSPLANRFLRPDQLHLAERFLPLHVLVCSSCFLVQLDELERPDEIFTDYVYFSSWSSSWLDHARRYVEQMTEALELDAKSLVVEVASNDGYLLRWFVDAGIPVLGVEPATNVAEVARARGIPTIDRFFGAALAHELRADRGADLIAANNVLAHVPDLHDFVEGFRIALADTGVVTVEFPHVLRLMLDVQFDTIYHEHFSYLSLAVVQRVFAEHGLRVIEVEQLPTHGGSLRVHATHAGGPRDRPTAAVERVLQEERAAGLDDVRTYVAFDDVVRREKRAILRVLLDELEAGRRVVGYGAAAKGNTLLNFCGIGRDMLDFVADASTDKQGLHLPGTHIPVVEPDAIRRERPDLVFVLPWNLRQEIMESLADISEWGGRFLVRDPHLRVIE